MYFFYLWTDTHQLKKNIFYRFYSLHLDILKISYNLFFEKSEKYIQMLIILNRRLTRISEKSLWVENLPQVWKKVKEQKNYIPSRPRNFQSSPIFFTRKLQRQHKSFLKFFLISHHAIFHEQYFIIKMLLILKVIAWLETYLCE